MTWCSGFGVAVTRTGTMPLTVAPLAGLVIATEGLSVSGRTAGEVAARRRTGLVVGPDREPVRAVRVEAGPRVGGAPARGTWSRCCFAPSERVIT